MLSSVARRGYRVKSHATKKRRVLSGALGMDSFIIVLAGFLVIAVFQAVQIGKLHSRTNEVYNDIMMLRSEQEDTYEKYGRFFNANEKLILSYSLIG